MNAEEYNKEAALIDAAIEGSTGFRMLVAFQCIKCGKIINDVHDAINHRLKGGCA